MPIHETELVGFEHFQLEKDDLANNLTKIDLSIPRKLLLWAYMLLNGRYASISVVVKHCEENAKVPNFGF